MLRTIFEWNTLDKISAALCYKDYPKLEDYLAQVGYNEPYNGLPDCRAEGKEAHRMAKFYFKSLTKVFTVEELETLSVAIDVYEVE